MLELVDLTASHPTPSGSDQLVFRGVDLTIRRGEILSLLGPSGCGKSTLLRIIAGLAPAASGHIHVDAASGRPRIGIVFQDPHLLPWLDVAGNVALGLGYRTNRTDDPDRVIRALERLGIAHLATARVHRLSGGQAQRVALARTIVTEPDLLLLDEPFAALDPGLRRDLQAWVRGLRDERDTTMIFVTHDLDEALAVGDRLAVLRSDGDGLAGCWARGDLDRAALLRAFEPAVLEEVPA